MKNFLFYLLILVSFQANAQWSVLDTMDISKQKEYYLYQPFTKAEWDASNFASAKDMKWFNDARYGMFIHFGLSTYIGKDLSWGMCYTRKAPDSGHGPIADSVWTKYPEKFKLENFNAKEWVAIAKKAGVKYIVTIAKHHDGFHLWDTKFSDFKITNTPFGRNYLKEIADACHEAGMKFGIYYSQRDWYHPDYQPVDTSMVDHQKNPPYFKLRKGYDKVKPGPRHHNYVEYQRNVVKELCSNYGKVDIFWFDALYWAGMFTADMWDAENLTRMIRKLQPGVIINNRASVPGDFDSPEQKMGFYQDRPWESCLTLCESWSWSPTPSKTKNELVKIIAGAASGNGNALLSWGPKWNGEYAEDQKLRLFEVGSWLKKYGTSIYNTRGGPWKPASWGGSTFSGKKAFVHIFKVDASNTLQLPMIDNKILTAKSLTGGSVKFVQNKNGVLLDLSNAKTDEEILVELIFEKPLKVIEAVAKKSKFDDPTFGHEISNGITANSGNINFKNKWKSISTTQQSQPFVVFNLLTTKNITGLQIENKQIIEGEVQVQISENGKNWQTIETRNGDKGTWEIVIAQMNAGTMLPGIKTKYIKINALSNTKQSLVFDKIKIFEK